MLKLSDFDYTLPKGLIAQYPLKKRDMARLLVLDRKTKEIKHRIFKDLTDYLAREDLLVLNNTKVLPARLFGKRKSGGKVEILLLRRKEGFLFDALLKPARLKLNEKIIFDDHKFSATVTAKNEVSFFASDIDEIYKHGSMPLPPYIKRDVQLSDFGDYQTVYAENDGAVASPTAGLHFTQELLGRIHSAGVNAAYITLHVGFATFRPVKSVDITQHKMEEEYFSIGQEATGLINQTRNKGRRILAVGTTSCRSLETYATGKSQGHTNLFIYPGYKFKMTDCLLTNFHLPRTTLFMLVCAFAGTDLMKKAYQEAIDKEYRFYSYGDAMLII